MKRIITDISGSFILNNGVKMPYLGLGVFECENVEKALHWAFEKGYRHVDTASLYGNEKRGWKSDSRKELLLFQNHLTKIE